MSALIASTMVSVALTAGARIKRGPRLALCGLTALPAALRRAEPVALSRELLRLGLSLRPALYVRLVAALSALPSGQKALGLQCTRLTACETAVLALNLALALSLSLTLTLSLSLTLALSLAAVVLATALPLAATAVIMVIILGKGRGSANEEDGRGRHEKGLFHLAPPNAVD